MSKSASSYSRVRRGAGAAAALLILVSATQLWAPKLLGPPSDALFERPGAVLVARVLEQQPSAQEDSTRVRFRRTEILYSSAPKKFWLEVPDAVAASMHPGKRYVLAINEYRRSLFNKYVYEKDRNGPWLMGVPAVGPAAIEDSAPLRVLLRRGDERLTERLDAALTLLLDESRIARLFGGAELYLDTRLSQVYSERDLSRLTEALEETTTEPLLGNYLLRAAQGVEAPGLEATCRRVALSLLEQNGETLDLGSDVPSLLVLALQTVAQLGEISDIYLADKHLRSNNPGVGKAALRAMEGLDLERTLELGRTAREDPRLHEETRRVLKQFLDRHSSASN